MHTGANQTSYVSSTGNYAGSETFPVATTTPSWFLLARVEVAAPPATGVIVAIGDSITDGTRSTPNTNNRWPDHLAKRLAQAAGPKMAVLNAGIAGNRVLLDNAGPNALARFDRDVLSQTGVTHVIVMEGINDIGQGRANPLPSAADLIAAHRQLILRAHARGLKIYRRHADAVRRRGLLDARGRGQARRAERVDSHQQGVRRRHRFRRRDPRSEPADEISRSSTIPGTTFTRAMLGIRRWQTRSICRCSA